MWQQSLKKKLMAGCDGVFTGITEEVGRITVARPNSLVILANKVLQKMEVGGSVAVNGVCLTVASFNSNSFSVDVMPETLKRTNLGLLRVGGEVNLERAMALGAPLGGHLVQGHIDDMGGVTSVTWDGEAIIMRFEAPPQVMRYVVEKGFIAVDGVSLTVVNRDSHSFQVSIVDYTRGNTILGIRRVGDLVNLEVDIIAKYVEQLSQAHHPGVTVEFLKEHGF